YGLQIGAPGIDTAYSAYIGTQEYQGNLWELDTNSMLCTYGGINYANPEESTFIVNGVANQQCNPPVTPVSLWFFSLTKQDNYNGCGACSAPGTPPRVVETGAPTGIDEAIVQDSLPTDLLNWKGRYRLYRKILRWPVMDNQSSYAGFKSAHSNQSTGQLAYIAEQRSGLFALTPTQQSSINAQSGAFLQHMIALRTLDSLRLTGIPVNENSYADLVTQRNTAATQLEALYFSIDTTRRNQIQTLASLNAAVTTSLASDTNHKTVNAIVFQLLLSDTLAAGDLAVLEAIAGQCPLEGGDAVYEARAIVMQLTGADFNDLDICASANRSIVRTEKKAEAKTVLYPNPTTGLVRWAESATDLVQVEVYDPFGRLLLTRLTTDPYIDLRPLPDGRYWIRLYSPAGGSTVQQVILVKE
ncbi:MAG TPA: T9SS type A sorting domain-containing protein, partial [Saprospiraceae bacterium]|nr:T9SS type A sorting domain-containing protein [Saprospiraceae bacterium]